MSALGELQADVTLVMDELSKICRRYGYDGIPTVVLRHTDGPSKSLLMSNDSPGAIVFTVAELGKIGNESSMTVHDATLKSILGDS